MSANPRVVTIIPARMASTRFPNKPLAPILGLAMVLHVVERCRLCPAAGRIVVATCDAEIETACARHGVESVMTKDSHPGCVDRTEEAIDLIDSTLADDDLVLMVQGDEVSIGPDMLSAVIGAYRERPVPVVNLVSPILSVEDHDDANWVKVVSAPDGRALFFSRAAIPSRSRAASVPMFQQTGVIGFSKSFLKTFGQLPQTPLEKLERIDMLRTLEHGYEIRVVETDRETLSVDTPADRVRAEVVLAKDQWTTGYLRPVS